MQILQLLLKDDVPLHQRIAKPDHPDGGNVGGSGLAVHGYMQHSAGEGLDMVFNQKTIQNVEIDVKTIILVGFAFLIWLVSMKFICKYMCSLPP